MTTMVKEVLDEEYNLVLERGSRQRNSRSLVDQVRDKMHSNGLPTLDFDERLSKSLAKLKRASARRRRRNLARLALLQANIASNMQRLDRMEEEEEHEMVQGGPSTERTDQESDSSDSGEDPPNQCRTN